MEWIYNITLYLFAAVSIYAAISDWNRFKIPNTVPLTLLLLWPLHVLSMPYQSEVWVSVACAGAFLGLGLYAFSKNWLGAGDVKFLSMAALWVPGGMMLNFILVISIAGGVLCAGLLVLRQWQIKKSIAVANSPQTAGISLKSPYLKQYAPYGVAIACGCLFTACQLLINAETLG